MPSDSATDFAPKCREMGFEKHEMEHGIDSNVIKDSREGNSLQSNHEDSDELKDEQAVKQLAMEDAVGMWKEAA